MTWLGAGWGGRSQQNTHCWELSKQGARGERKLCHITWTLKSPPPQTDRSCDRPRRSKPTRHWRALEGRDLCCLCVLQPQSEWHQPGAAGSSSRAGLPLCAPLVTQSYPVLARSGTLSRLVPGPEESTGPPVCPPGHVADEQAWGKAAVLGRLCHTVPQSIFLEVWHTVGTQ